MFPAFDIVPDNINISVAAVTNHIIRLICFLPYQNYPNTERDFNRGHSILCPGLGIGQFLGMPQSRHAYHQRVHICSFTSERYDSEDFGKENFNDYETSR
jgi:hypothetical protein